MRIIVQNPECLFQDSDKNFNGYNFEFVKEYCCGILLYHRPWKYFKYKKRMKKLGFNKKIFFTVKGAERNSDALVCFNGRPYEERNKPDEHYHKLKFFHTMDFSERIKEASDAMKRGKVDYLLGYCRHDKYSGFFKKYFTLYSDRVINVPFGYAPRFSEITPFDKRINKCIALGSVNPVNDPLVASGGLNEFISYYKDHKYSHEIRKAIVDHIEEWGQRFDSRLPVFPETKNTSYDAVEELNKYTMFINDASIDSFPPARTYEGIACGCVMVAENLPIYTELGFVDGENCILFKAGDYQQMLKKIDYYIENVGELKNIQEKSLVLAESYSHRRVAKKLYEDISLIIKEKTYE